MWCGPNAAAALTGWTRDQVWCHVRALRERRGKSFGPVPKGGTYDHEIFDAITRAGFAVSSPLPRIKPTTYGSFARGLGRSGRWLVLQRRHFFAHIGGRDRPLTSPTWVGQARILAVFRVERIGRSEAGEAPRPR